MFVISLIVFTPVSRSESEFKYPLRFAKLENARTSTGHGRSKNPLENLHVRKIKTFRTGITPVQNLQLKLANIDVNDLSSLASLVL